MITLLTVVHISSCILLVLVVLIQNPREDGLSSVFGGGGSQTLLGTGGANFLTKVTGILGAIFLITSIAMTLVFSRETPSVMEKVSPESAAPPPIEAPKVPQETTEP